MSKSDIIVLTKLLNIPWIDWITFPSGRWWRGRVGGPSERISFAKRNWNGVLQEILRVTGGNLKILVVGCSGNCGFEILRILLWRYCEFWL